MLNEEMLEDTQFTMSVGNTRLEQIDLFYFFKKKVVLNLMVMKHNSDLSVKSWEF